jgi:heptosyltransferase I
MPTLHRRLSAGAECRCSPRENETVLKILIVKLSAIGDVIHCLPVAAALKKRLPDAKISWLVEAASAELLQGNPCVDEVIVFKAKRWLKDSGNPLNWPQTGALAWEFVSELRKQKFDAALEMQGLLKSSLLTFISGAKIRIGFAETRESADRFLTHKVDVGDYFGHYVPVVELNLKIAQALLEVLGQKSEKLPADFFLPPLAKVQVDKIETLLSHPHIRNGARQEEALAQSSVNGGTRQAPAAELIPNKPSVPAMMPVPAMIPVPAMMPISGQAPGAKSKICAIIPGTTWVTKIWPEEKWLELSRRLARDFNYRLVLVGAGAERDVNTRLAEQLQSELAPGLVTDLTGQTSLLELVALFQKCDLVIGGDTGPLHLAAAVGKPKVLGIYGSTPWRRLGPYGPQCRSVASGIWCQPCYSKTCAIGTVACLTDLSVDEVFGAVTELIST